MLLHQLSTVSHQVIIKHFSIYSRTTLTRTLVVRIANYPNRLGPPFKYFRTVNVLYLFIIIIFLHGLGRLTCSGIDALPSFPRASTISSSTRFVVEDVFRESGVVHSFKMVDPVLCLDLMSCIPEISRSFLIFLHVFMA